MSIAPEPCSRSPSRRSGWWLVVGDDGVEVPEQEDARAARASTREAQEQVGRVPRRRAGHALDARLVGRQRRRDRGGLLRAAHVARRRRDADEGLELAREAGLDRGGVLGDPGVHGSRRVPAMAGPKVGDLAPDFALEGTEGPFRLADHRGQRVVLLFYPGRPHHGLHEAVLLLPRPRRRHGGPRRGRRRDLRPGPRLARELHRRPRADRAAAGRRRQARRAARTGSAPRSSARAAPSSSSTRTASSATARSTRSGSTSRTSTTCAALAAL